MFGKGIFANRNSVSDKQKRKLGKAGLAHHCQQNKQKCGGGIPQKHHPKKINFFYL